MPINPLFLIVLWIGSIVAGWNRFPVWILIPPLVVFVVLMAAQGRAEAVLKQSGVRDTTRFHESMWGPTIKVVGWQFLLHSILFGAGFFVGGFFR
jgi:hypothetical protein